MQSLKKYIIYVTGLLTTLTSCQDEELFNYKERVEEGISTQIQLNYKVDASPILTRATQDTKEEYWLDNMYVIIFDEQGNRIKTTDDQGNPRNYFAPGEEGGSFNPSNGGDDVKGTISFKSMTANNARIVGIANIKTTTTSTAYSTVTKDKLDGINTLQELQQIVMEIEDKEPIERGGRFMMTGYAEDENGNNRITISGSEGGVSKLSCTLKLRRVDAKIEVRMTAEAGNPLWQHFSFEPKKWSVMRAPMQSLLLPADQANAQGHWDADGQYADTYAREFEQKNIIDVNNEHLYAGGSFAFYMPENRKHYKKEITDNNYALRDKQIKNPVSSSSKPGQTEENGDFEYADDNATYLLLTGQVSYTNENGNDITTDTRYIIHLGYAKKQGETTANVNDYDTRRNGHYIYNIKVKGVNDIEVEVTDKNEVRPGYEGDIVYSSKKTFKLDSHYDRELLEIRKEDITDKMTWSVKTPFSAGIYQGGPIPNELKDYKWIKFAINKHYGQTEGYFVKYPGDQNYDDPDIEGDGIDSPYYESYEGGKYKNARLMDINQLIAYLKENKDNNELYDGDHICITAFVDENLYFVNPQTGETGQDNRSLWKSSVEKEDRQLHIITEQVQYSPDGNSSKVNSLYTFTQKAIRTIYNVNKAELTTAWGLESVMETERLKPGNVKTTDGKTSSMRNGRENCLTWLVGKKWTEILNTSDHYGLNDNFNTAAYACLLRNRDLNGDDIIDANEVRWYLAAIDQLTDIYLGEYALDDESRLYPADPKFRPGTSEAKPYWHYTSSSANGDDPWVLWAEEGASRGSYGDSKKEEINGELYAYRCIRNLGLSLDNPNENPTDLVYIDPIYPNIIDLTNMNPKALRSNFETTSLPNHNEKDADNRPYSKFEVYPEDSPTPKTERPTGGGVNFTNANNWRYYQTNTSMLPPGYRIPNQRELLIMSSRMPEETWNTYSATSWWQTDKSKASYICQTAFSLNGKGPYKVDVDGDRDWWNPNTPKPDGYYDREGFIFHAQGGNFSLQNSRYETGYIRAVRDIR